ncbi:AAA family ATPase [Pseudomonas izuensis]|uniref:AAA family ATPase n=1 Tax=Pseudomonas izuensis TaxID=2684212 RepID=UPI00135BA426|nr:ATP-binding protein [Pseudomonas izuensis]
MLIEFSVSNYRSFREKQTLSMVATPRLSKKRNVFKPKVNGEKLPDLLKVAAIYGPNASGKSSLIQAMGVVNTLLMLKPTVDGALPVKAFRFDPDLREKASVFEYHFVASEVRYQFVVGMTEQRITEEKLIAYPKGKETLLYDRFLTNSGENYVFGEALEGGSGVHKAWRNLTSPQHMFLSQAVLNSSEDLNQLRIVLGWFKTSLWVIEQNAMPNWALASRSFIKRNPKYSASLETFLREIDVPVSSVRLVSENKNISLFKGVDITLEDVPNLEQECKTTLTHSSNLGEADFDFSEESGGTKNLIGFWLPWVKMNLKLDDGGIGGMLAIDEFDSSLHPEIVADLVDKHLDSGLIAQLIFTTHDTHLMNAKILRRDQFWITERDANGATNLFSVHDFVGREGEDVEKRYFEGRYRGLPLIHRR